MLSKKLIYFAGEGVIFLQEKTQLDGKQHESGRSGPKDFIC